MDDLERSDVATTEATYALLARACAAADARAAGARAAVPVDAADEDARPDGRRVALAFMHRLGGTLLRGAARRPAWWLGLFL